MTEVMTAAEYRAEMGKPKREKESIRITRLFLSQIRARKLPVPRSKLHPDGELWFAKGVEGITRFKPGKTNRTPAWRFDFAWEPQRIAVEYQGLNVFKGDDGKMHTSGGHADVQHIRKQHEKHAWATVLGWRVLYFERDMVAKGYAIDMLVRMFAALEAMPAPLVVSIADIEAAANQPGLPVIERLMASGRTTELDFGGKLDRDPF